MMCGLLDLRNIPALGVHRIKIIAAFSELWPSK